MRHEFYRPRLGHTAVNSPWPYSKHGKDSGIENGEMWVWGVVVIRVAAVARAMLGGLSEEVAELSTQEELAVKQRLGSEQTCY